MPNWDADVAVVGGSAAGLTAAIFAKEVAAESGAQCRCVILESARKPGAKILVSGGGRCNITNQAISIAEDFWGGSSTTIRSVIRAFDENRTRQWMDTMGVETVIEETGKVFPKANRARAVLDALLDRVTRLNCDLRLGWRMQNLKVHEDGFVITSDEGKQLFTRRVILATGGLSLPKSGSDGHGLALARGLGHTMVSTVPALAPIVLEVRRDHPAADFVDWSGITIPAKVELRQASGKRVYQRVDSLLFTHFGISGPAALNVSRHWLRDRSLQLSIGVPGFDRVEDADSWFQEHIRKHPRQALSTALQLHYPERIAQSLAAFIGNNDIGQLTRELRLEAARYLAQLPLAVRDSRGYSFAETTAGGVDLREIAPQTMESRKVPGLYMCGEMLDVDGRIGGFNFQWAWSTGYLAGRAATRSLSLQNLNESIDRK